MEWGEGYLLMAIFATSFATVRSSYNTVLQQFQQSSSHSNNASQLQIQFPKHHSSLLFTLQRAADHKSNKAPAVQPLSTRPSYNVGRCIYLQSTAPYPECSNTIDPRPRPTHIFHGLAKDAKTFSRKLGSPKI